MSNTPGLPKIQPDTPVPEEKISTDTVVKGEIVRKRPGRPKTISNILTQEEIRVRHILRCRQYNLENKDKRLEANHFRRIINQRAKLAKEEDDYFSLYDKVVPV
jgi:hypothetical protein